MGATVEIAIRLYAVPDDPHATVLARWGQGMNRALEAVKSTRIFARETYLEGLVVVVAADLALGRDRGRSRLALGQVVLAARGSQSPPWGPLEWSASGAVH